LGAARRLCGSAEALPPATSREQPTSNRRHPWTNGRVFKPARITRPGRRARHRGCATAAPDNRRGSPAPRARSRRPSDRPARSAARPPTGRRTPAVSKDRGTGRRGSGTASCGAGRSRRTPQRAPRGRASLEGSVARERVAGEAGDDGVEAGEAT
jgi:hypothetical protein